MILHHRNILLLAIIMLCAGSILAQTRRYKGAEEAPIMSILLRQNTDNQSIDVIVYSSESISNTFLELNEQQVPIEVNKPYKMATLPNDGTLRVIQMEGADILQLAAVKVDKIIWSENIGVAASGGDVSDFGDNSGGGYLFGSTGGGDSFGGTSGGGSTGGGFGESVSGGGSYTGGEFDPDRKDEGVSGRGGFSAGGGTAGGENCQVLQDSLTSLLQKVNGLEKLNKNLAAENKLLTNKVERLEGQEAADSVATAEAEEVAEEEGGKKKKKKKEQVFDIELTSTAKEGVGFSLMPTVSYGQFTGRLITTDGQEATSENISNINAGLNVGISFNATKDTRGYAFLGAGINRFQSETATVNDTLGMVPSATAGWGLDLTPKLFIGNQYSFLLKDGADLSTRFLVGYRKENMTFGGTVTILAGKKSYLWRIEKSTVPALGAFFMMEFGGN